MSTNREKPGGKTAKISRKKGTGKKKFSKIDKMKKPLIVGSVIAALAVAGIISGIYIFNFQRKVSVLNIDLNWYLNSLDPLYIPNADSFTENKMVWSQLVEGLFDHDQSREDAPIIPCLAKDLGTWSPDGLNFTCALREGVYFHDGTLFNATAVKWNFDRLYNFIDIKPENDIEVWDYMYELPDGSRRINETKVIDEYTVRFVLNEPYAPLRALLASFQSCILSPSSTPEDDFVDVFTGKLVGTGPFILESYTMDPDDEISGNITVVANGNYWEGKPKIDEVHFLRLSDVDCMLKILNGEMQYTLVSGDLIILDIYKNSLEVNIIPITHPSVFYLSMNNDLFPLEMRKAISYAFNYSDFIDYQSQVYNSSYVRCKSPLSKGMLYSNWDLNVSYTNLKIARQTLIEASWSGTSGLTANDNISSGNEWEKLVDDGTPLAIYNFSIKSNNDRHVSHSILLTKYLKQIGVKVVPDNLTSQEWEDKVNAGNLEFFIIGFGPAFNDPVEMVDPIYTIGAQYNFLNFTDTQVQIWVEQGLVEQNETARGKIYYNIQKRLVEELYPVAWICSKRLWNIWSSNIKGVPQESAPFRFTLKYAYFDEN